MGSVCIGVIALELAVRYILNERTHLEGMFTGDPVVGSKLAAGFRGSARTAEFQYDVAVNEVGMRDNPIPEGQPQGARILVIGDSFVFGDGVQVSQSLPKVLQRRLQRSEPARGVEVFNGGVPGYSPFHELHTLRRLAPLIQPNLVVQVVFMGDDWYGNNPRQSPDEARSDPIQQLRRHSSAFRFFERFVFSRFKGEDHYEAHRVSLPPEFLARVDKVLALLEETRAFSSRSGATYLIVLCPRYAQVYDDAWGKARMIYGLSDSEYTQFEPNSTFGRRLDARGLPYVDLLEPLRQEGKGRRLHFDMDGHWNPDGHEFVAGLLVPRVAALLDETARRPLVGSAGAQ